MSAAEVVEITRAEIDRVRAELNAQAAAVAESRLRRFEDRIRAEFEENEALRPAFADPDFQFSLHDASRAAVSNDDQHTEDLLIDLLRNRAEKGNEARVRLATSHAIRAADKLSLEALNGLTGIWVLSMLGPAQPGIDFTLAAIQASAIGLVEMGLPKDSTWTEDADALNLGRLSGGGLALSRTAYRQVLENRIAAFLVPGIDADASRDLLERATSACPWLKDKAQPHPLKPGFVLLPWATAEELRSELPPECAELAPVQEFIEHNRFGQRDESAVAEFNRKVDESEAVVQVLDWWGQVPPLGLTVIGNVIGFVNAKRYVQFGGAQTVAELLARIVQ